MSLLLTGLLLAPASAQEAAIKKSEKAWSKYDGSEKALVKVRDTIAPAKDHIDTRDQAKTWVLYADVAREYAMNPDYTSPWADPLVEAIQAYDVAVGKDGANAYHERVLEGVLTLESTLNTRLIDAFEREDHGAAWSYVQPLVQAHGIVRQIGKLDPSREIAALQYATLTAVHVGRYGEAVQFHKELDAAGGRKAGTTKAVADALLAQRDLAAKFITRWSEKDPRNAVLLETRFDLLFEQGDEAQVRAILEEHAGDRGSAIAITLAHARALQRLGDFEAASATFAQARELEPRDQDVAVEHADMLVAQADAMPAKSWSQRKAQSAVLDEAIGILVASMELDPAHRPTLEKLAALYERTKSRDREAIARVEAAIEALESK